MDTSRSSKNVINENNFILSTDKLKQNKDDNNINNEEDKIKNSEDKNIKKKLVFSVSDKNLETTNFRKKLNFSQKNKNIFQEFLKKTLIKKGDKELLLIKCLKKDPQVRTKDDNNTIKNFLHQSKLMNALLNIPFFEHKNCENILSSISSELKYKSFNEDENLFKIGDNVDNFYIIYNGNIIIESLECYAISLSCRQYIKSIVDKYQKIYDYKDEYTISGNKNNNLMTFKKIIFDEDNHNYSKYILEKILKANKNIVNIEEDEIKYLNLILLIIDIKDIFSFRGNYNALLLLINDYNYDYKKILSGMDYLENNFFVHNVDDNMKQIYKNLPILNPKLVKKYEKIIEDSNNFAFKFFKKGKITYLENMGECFGDTTLELKFDNLNESLKRDYSASATEITNLAYIPFERLSELLKIEKEEIKNTETKFLRSSFFFKGMNSFNFTKKYMKYFIYEELLYNNYLFKQGQKDNYVYFLKFGKYEIFCLKNIEKICTMISDLSKNYLDKSKKSEYIKLINNIIKNLRWCSFIKKEFLNEIPIKLLVLTQNFVLGLESLYNDLPYLYNAKVLSEKGGYYKIEYKYLLQMMEEIKGGKEILMNENNYHLELILGRLINICHKKVKFINNERKITLFDNNDNPKSNKNKVKIKNKVITNKIKEFLRINHPDKKNFFDSNICLTSREYDENTKLRKEKGKAKLYFLTEISKIEENENVNENKGLGITYNKINNIVRDNKANVDIIKSKSSSINQYYKKRNIITYSNEKQKLIENSDISKINYNYKEFNKISKYNPVKIKYEVNLSKKLKSTIENELLFYYYKEEKIRRKIKTTDIKSKTNKEENKGTNIITINKNTKDACNVKDLSGKVILPYYNSTKNVIRKIDNLIPLELETIPKKKRNSTRNKLSNLNLFNITNENNFAKYTISTNTDNLIENTLFNEKYNKTFNCNKLNNNYDENQIDNNFNKTVYNFKNNNKGYTKFNGINYRLKSNIESYSFKGKKYFANYRNAYNKTLYKSIKDRVEDNMFMNGQTSSPKINKNYY